MYRKIFIGFLVSTATVSLAFADSWYIVSQLANGEDYGDCNVTVSSDKATYAPNEAATLSGSLTAGGGGSNTTQTKCSAQVNNSGGAYIVGDNTFRAYIWNTSGSAGTNAAGSPGAQSFTIYTLVAGNPGPANTSTHSLAYTVSSASVILNITEWFKEKADTVLSLLSVDRASAQTGTIVSDGKSRGTAIVVAKVNLTNAKVEKLADSTYTLSFNLTNRGELQTDVRYRVMFVDKNEQVVNTHTYPAVLSLEKNKPISVSEKLLVPGGLQGTYFVQVQAVTTTGLPLGIGVAGTVSLEGGSATPSLTDCAVSKKGYEKNTMLPVTCTLSSSKTSDYILKSYAYYRTQPVETTSALGGIQGSEGTVLLKGILTPGTYTIVTQLLTRSGNIPTGKEIVNKFVVNGTSASFMNLLLDKDFYRAGDSAKGTFSFTYFTTEPNKHFKLVGNLTGKGGECAKEIKQDITRSAYELNFPVTSRCVDPTLSAKIVDEKGTVLATKTLSLVSKNTPISPTTQFALAIIALGLITLVLYGRKGGKVTKAKKR